MFIIFSYMLLISIESIAMSPLILDLGHLCLFFFFLLSPLTVELLSSSHPSGIFDCHLQILFPAASCHCWRKKVSGVFHLVYLGSPGLPWHEVLSSFCLWLICTDRIVKVRSPKHLCLPFCSESSHQAWLWETAHSLHGLMSLNCSKFLLYVGPKNPIWPES